jgi:hypothetical protein
MLNKFINLKDTVVGGYCLLRGNWYVCSFCFILLLFTLEEIMRPMMMSSECKNEIKRPFHKSTNPSSLPFPGPLKHYQEEDHQQQHT